MQRLVEESLAKHTKRPPVFSQAIGSARKFRRGRLCLSFLRTCGNKHQLTPVVNEIDLAPLFTSFQTHMVRMPFEGVIMIRL